MKIIVVSKNQAKFDLIDKEVEIIKSVFAEVKNILDHEPEFETRVGAFYVEGQHLAESLSKMNIISLQEVTIINNILNEACNGIKIDNFDQKIGSSKTEVESYLVIVNKVMNELRGLNN